MFSKRGPNPWNQSSASYDYATTFLFLVIPTIIASGGVRVRGLLPNGVSVFDYSESRIPDNPSSPSYMRSCELFQPSPQNFCPPVILPGSSEISALRNFETQFLHSLDSLFIQKNTTEEH
ncbi:hypothetical protein CAEBREN_17018 [Caenorhabditis brenneri]|uniref:Uncharacterized protein n=1 Tax=Caenorhabditis brenneri TaxID=135651 RepID=G0NZD2_CAEBE|nr:hypothetical protein CAEBREN_17018 [Caenorhabditis brenneri]